MIHSYHTPAHNSLPRHIMTYISPQISHIREARPLSVGAGNAIRYLKSEITSLASMEDDIPERDVSFLQTQWPSLISDATRRRKNCSVNVWTTLSGIVLPWQIISYKRLLWKRSLKTPSFSRLQSVYNVSHMHCRITDGGGFPQIFGGGAGDI